MKTVWVSHPVAGDVRGNCCRAQMWLEWCSEIAGIEARAPYLASLLQSGYEERDRAAGLARCVVQIADVDEVWLVGGRISTGMALEEAAAIALGVVVRDLTCLGEFPPAGVEQ